MYGTLKVQRKPYRGTRPKQTKRDRGCEKEVRVKADSGRCKGKGKARGSGRGSVAISRSPQDPYSSDSDEENNAQYESCGLSGGRNLIKCDLVALNMCRKHDSMHDEEYCICPINAPKTDNKDQVPITPGLGSYYPAFLNLGDFC